MRKQIAAVAALLVGAACGGSNDTQNAAAGKTFTYGTPSAATSSQSSALQGQLAGAIALNGATDASSAESLSDFGSVTSALLGEVDVGGGLLSASPQALTIAGGSPLRRLASVADSGTFDNPGCVTKTATSLTLSGCKISISDSATSSTATITADGSATLGGQTLTWKFTIGVDLNDSSGDSASVTVGRSGTLTVTSASIQGNVLSTLNGSWTVGGNSDSLAVSEAVILDGITFQTNPDCITGGTLEAKRVWAKRPSGMAATDYPDRGAKVTWTGCGIVTVAFST